MVVKGMIMCRKDWIGHVPRWNGEISSLIAMSLTYKQRILIIYQYSSPYNPRGKPEREKKKKKKTLHFKERWATHPNYVNVIQMAWEAEVTPGNPMARPFEKIKKGKFALVDWGRDVFGSSNMQLQAKQKLLEELCLQIMPTVLARSKNSKPTLAT